MAKIKKDEPQQAESSLYDFIIPLELHELKKMWNEYTNGKKIINFRSSSGKLCLAEYVYYNKSRVMSYDDDTYQFNSYVPQGLTDSEFNYSFEKAKRNWKQFEEYARKREYAIAQNDSNLESLISSNPDMDYNFGMF